MPIRPRSEPPLHPAAARAVAITGQSQLWAHRWALAAAPVLGIVAFPPPAYAEVWDKVATVPQIWLFALGGGVLGAIAWRINLLFGALFAPLAAAPTVAVLLEVYDPSVGPAIQSELGSSYSYQAHGAGVVLVLLFAAGALMRIRSKSRVGKNAV